MNHIHHNLLKLTGNHLAASSIIIAVNGLIILCTFLLIEEVGNKLLFILIMVSGFILASIPTYILKWQKINRKSTRANKSIIALSIFFKRLRD